MKDYNISEDFYALINKYPNVSSLINQLQEYGEVLLFGGVIREYNDSKFNNMPRDFDIVINKINSNVKLDNVLNNFLYYKNRFDGYKIEIDSIKLDIWELEKTWAFREKKVEYSKNEYPYKLQETVFLNIDSIVYNLTTKEVYNDKYREAMELKELDIVLEENPYKDLNILRALVFKRKYNMKFSDKLTLILEEYIQKNYDYINKLYEVQFKHYNEYKLDKYTIENEINSIIKNKSIKKLFL